MRTDQTENGSRTSPNLQVLQEEFTFHQFWVVSTSWLLAGQLEQTWMPHDEQHARSGNIWSGRRETSPHPFGQELALHLTRMGNRTKQAKLGHSPDNYAYEGLLVI